MGERRTEELANAIVEKAGWKALIFPLFPWAPGPANTVARKHVFPGSYTVRPSTLRAVFMDLATDLGEQGFRWIFLVHMHLSPSNNRVLNQAGDYFHDTYGGQMVHLEAFLTPQRRSSRRRRTARGCRLRSWRNNETSFILFLRPDLVSPAYKNAEPLPAHDQKQRIEIAKADNWPGYWGSPSLATAAAGAARWKANSSRWVELALKILDGFDYRQLKRFGDETVFGESTGGTTFAQHNQEIETKQHEWLKQKRLE